MNQQLAHLQEATIKQNCKSLRMPMIASQFSAVAETSRADLVAKGFPIAQSSGSRHSQITDCELVLLFDPPYRWTA